MIVPGVPLPAATLWTEPGGNPVQLERLADGGPVLLLVYLYDWSPT